MTRKSKWLLAVGLVLVLAGVGLFLFTRISAAVAQEQVAGMVAKLDRLLPGRDAGVAADLSGEMPVLSLDGRDVVALLEIPTYEVSLPVGATWSSRGVTAYPRRFSGSAYDSNLVVGGCDRAGQLACLAVIPNGTAVVVRDMTGARMTYTVARVERSATADSGVLLDAAYDLTLFVRDTYSLEYILVRCTVA